VELEEEGLSEELVLSPALFGSEPDSSGDELEPAVTAVVFCGECEEGELWSDLASLSNT